MAESEQNRSEQASPYKLDQARKKGMIPRSPEAGVVCALACAFGYLWARGDSITGRLALASARAFNQAGNAPAGTPGMLAWLHGLVGEATACVAPLIAVSVGGALAGTLLQTGLLLAPAALKPDFSKLNPAHGFKRVFSTQTLVEAAKAIFKMVVYVAIAWSSIFATTVTAEHAALSPESLAAALRSRSLRLVGGLLVAAAIFALIDQVLVRRAFARKMRMSRHELRQEHKQREGDPRIRQRRRQLQRELLQRSASLRNMRNADVLVTNPTHFAIGLRYDPVAMAAPKLVARGTGDFALRLRRLAFLYNVPVVESRQLARQLWREAPFEHEVPPHLYRNTAAVYLHMRHARAQQAGAA
jgi:flagellar biosynthesis protein FlhB